MLSDLHIILTLRLFFPHLLDILLEPALVRKRVRRRMMEWIS
jgi:hypothetical protein